MSIIRLKSLPTWVPDEHCKCCFICSEYFTWYFRIHHCRVCGQGVCAYCSPHRLPLSTYQGSIERVCDFCEKAVRIIKTESKDGQIDENALDVHLSKICEFMDIKMKQQQPTISPTTYVQSLTLDELLANDGEEFSPSLLIIENDQEDFSQLELQRENSTVALSTVELQREDSTVVCGSVAGSTSSTAGIIVTGNNSPSGDFSGLSDFMSDLINTPDSPVPTPQAVTPQKTLPPKAATLNPASTPQVNVSIATLVSDRSLNLTLDPLSTPQGKKAQQRAQHSSLQRSLTRPTQHGTGTPATLSSSTAHTRLRTMKRTQLQSLIQQAQFAAVSQEVDLQNKGTSTDNLDVGSLLDIPSEVSVTPQAQSEAAGAPVIVVDDASTLPPTTPRSLPTLSSTPSLASTVAAAAGRYSLVDLFNCIWSKNAPIVIDTRDVLHYNVSHVPFSINIPITLEDVDLETSSFVPGVTMAVLLQRIATANDQRGFRMRKGRSVIIVGQEVGYYDAHSQTEYTKEQIYEKLQAQYDSLKQRSQAHIITKNDIDGDKSVPVPEIANEYDMIPHIIPQIFASLLLTENSVSSVDIVAMGAQEFCVRYPFLHCSSFNNKSTSGTTMPQLDKKDAKHVHIPRFPAYPNEILDSSIYLGSEADASARLQLEKLGITHIINATQDLPNVYENTMIDITQNGEIMSQPLFHYLRCPINDTHDQPLLEQLQHAFDFIDNALGQDQAGRVLVHCQMGISRSTSIVVGYVMRSYHCTLYNALAMVKSRRQQIQPNPMFIEELAKFECLLFNYDSLDQSTYKQCMAELYPSMSQQ